MSNKYISVYTLMRNPKLIEQIKSKSIRNMIMEERERHFRLGRFQAKNWMEEYVEKHPFPK